MKNGRKVKSVVSFEQVVEYLSSAKRLGRTLPDMARHFGTTKERIKRALGKNPGEWRSVGLSTGTTVYVVRKYKDHEVRRLHSRIAATAL